MPPTDRPTTYLRPDDLAERWQTTTKTLSNWRHRGEGPAYVKIGSSVRYPLSAVEDFEDAGRVEPVAA